MSESHNIFLTGGTGYMGSRLASLLLRRGHKVRALVRGKSPNLPAGCDAVSGDALSDSYAPQVAGTDTFIHLVGVAHPGPSKAAEFRSIDLKALQCAVRAASGAGVRHFVFVSVAHPSPVMKAYIAVREECEQIIGAGGMNATILRPWYVLGPGHRWPYALVPFYWMMERIPATRERALRLGLVTLPQMIQTMAAAVESPPNGVRVLDVPAIRGQDW